MQPKHKVDEIKFELYETITWEYVMLHDELFRNTGDEEVHDLEENNVSFLSYLCLVEQNIRWGGKIEIFGTDFRYAASMES